MVKSKTEVIAVRIDGDLKKQIEELKSENPSFLREVVEKATKLSALHKKFPSYSVDAIMWKTQFEYTTKSGLIEMAKIIHNLLCQNSGSDNLNERLSVMLAWFSIHNITSNLTESEGTLNILVNHDLGKNFSRLIIEIIHFLSVNSNYWNDDKHKFTVEKTEFSDIHLFTNISREII